MPKNPELILKFKTIIDTLNRELYKAKSEYLELERKEKALIALQCEVTQARNDLEYLQTQKFIYA